MKRIQEKVKDIVEVRSYESIRDFTSDPAQTLANYHFSDATSELMSVWVDRIASVHAGRGGAYALAGYRGVGKSHFLATLGALVSHPELRPKVTDQRVSVSAQLLSRRRYPVAYVRRGTHDTLLEEFKTALSAALETDSALLGDSLTEILQAASAKAGELPFVLMVDTAFERGSRVARDDGRFLSELAEAAKELNIFLGVALDDDIAGADGLNSAIARSFTIDYLDQEHLYKVVNSHIFPKAAQMQPVLHDIYEYFREVLPSFRWSEQRFSSLYPLHPAILEVAPFVRLYVHDFALLSFASIAAERIMGRPANSLIALDEVFDSAEKGLRKIEDLDEAFAAYDKLNAEVVAKIPVMQRLQAKLILKALLLLSLDGEGTTAGEISAAMLIFDEAEPERAVETVHGLIRTFAEALPEDVRITTTDNNQTRYGFKVSSKDNLNKALSESIERLPEGIVEEILRKQFIERFADCSLSAEEDPGRKEWMDSHAEWRGGSRRGRIFWSSFSDSAADKSVDWEVIVDLNGRSEAASAGDSGVSRIVWRPDELTREEKHTILRYYALSTDGPLREEFSEQIRASLHSHSVSAEKIFSRAFLEDGKLVIDGFDYNCTDEARAAATLSELFGVMLEPLFETRFPLHPYFEQKLEAAQVTALVSDLYGGSRQNLPEVQKMAQLYALPLGLVHLKDGAYTPASGEQLGELPLAASVLQLCEKAGDETVSLATVYAELRKEPYGLVREGQHLLLAAMVAGRRIEFVTSKGDRINRRSLDLTIIWDDIVGVAKPVGADLSVKKLLRWAALFAGTAKIASFSEPSDVESLRSGLEKWLAEWDAAGLPERFNAVPDHLLNVHIWRLAGHALKVFGSVAENIRTALEKGISFEECFDRIADIFSDSEDRHLRAKNSLSIVSSFVDGIAARNEVASFISVSEVTDSPEIEEMREQLYQRWDASSRDPNDAGNRELGYLWAKFRRDYSVHYCERHEFAMVRAYKVRDDLDTVIRSERWWEFENLSAIPLFDGRFWERSLEIRRRGRGAECKANVREVLETNAVCVCGFSIGRNSGIEGLVGELENVVSEGLKIYRRQLAGHRAMLASSLDQAATEDPAYRSDADITAFVEILRSGSEITEIPASVITALQKLLLPISTADSLSNEDARSGPENRDADTSLRAEYADEAVGINV